VRTIVEVGSLAASGNQRMCSRMEIDPISKMQAKCDTRKVQSLLGPRRRVDACMHPTCMRCGFPRGCGSAHDLHHPHVYFEAQF
jgi:hypothetical protein